MFNSKQLKTKLLFKHQSNPNEDLTVTLNVTANQESNQENIKRLSEALSNIQLIHFDKPVLCVKQSKQNK